MSTDLGATTGTCGPNGSGHVLAFDTETALIRPGLLAPPMVCLTWQRSGQEARIAHHADSETHLKAWLEDTSGTKVIVGHNVAYDMAVVCERFPRLRPLVFRAYDEDRVTDTMIRQQLIDIAAGVYRGSVNAKGKRVQYKYTLEDLAKRCCKMQLQKDAWRLSYAEFIDVPLSQWPGRAKEVQAKARARLAEILARVEYGDNPSSEQVETMVHLVASQRVLQAQSLKDKDLENQIAGLVAMITSNPEQCIKYPLDDARATLAVYESQEVHAAYLVDQFRQARGAFHLHLNSAWGLRTDPAGVEKLRAAVQEDLEEVEKDLKELGLVRSDGTRDTKVAKRRMIEVCAELGIPVVRTDAHFENEEGKKEPLTLAQRAEKKLKPRCKKLDGTPLDDGHDDCEEHICLDTDACERTEDEVLMAYSERGTLGKQLSNDIPALEGGTIYPVHTRYGLAATGRSTSSKPNIQNQSKREGFREAFVPRPGRVFIQCDFPGLELYTWAQFCKTTFGFSRLADALNAGKDAHLILAANLLRVTYEAALPNKKSPEVKNARDRAKPGNFGFAGGMGVPKFLTSTRKGMGRKAFEALGLDEEEGRKLKDTWKRTWPESKAHFDRASELCEAGGGLGRVEVPFTGLQRGGTTYCATCNTPFQGLGAACAKEAGWRIAKAQYIGTPSKRFADANPGKISPLYNGRSVAMVHDEYIAEVDDNEFVHDAAMELAALMVEGANVFLPDVPIPFEKMEPLAMLRWSKGAQPAFNEEGRLIPWAA